MSHFNKIYWKGNKPLIIFLKSQNAIMMEAKAECSRDNSCTASNFCTFSQISVCSKYFVKLKENTVFFAWCYTGTWKLSFIFI